MHEVSAPVPICEEKRSLGNNSSVKNTKRKNKAAKRLNKCGARIRLLYTMGSCVCVFVASTKGGLLVGIVSSGKGAAKTDTRGAESCVKDQGTASPEEKKELHVSCLIWI